MSVDSVFSHKAFAEKIGIEFPLVSDFNRDVSSAYGVLIEEIFGFKNVAKRALFVIDQAGTVQYARVIDDPNELPDADEALAVLRNL